HVVEHCFRSDILFGVAGFARPHFVEARIGAVAVFLLHLPDFFFFGFGSAGLSPSAASFANRKARRCAVRLRIATSAAAISAIALMPSASWGAFWFMRSLCSLC